MELTLKSLHDDRDAFLAAGYHLPEFDYDTVHKNTVEHPHWIHFGAGNIFRAFQANVAQNLLNSGILDTGLIAAEGYDYEIIEKSYRPHDNLSILATLKADNTVEKTIVGSIMESLILDSKTKQNTHVSGRFLKILLSRWPALPSLKKAMLPPMPKENSSPQ